MTHDHKLMAIGHRHEHMAHDEEQETINESATPAYIFDSMVLGEEIPNGFNAVKIALDGSLKSDLKWEKQRKMAVEYIKKGYKVFWEIQLGLFDSLEKPLSDQSQFLSLCLSLEHFRDTFWKEFQKDSVGLCLYRGSADYRVGFHWDDEQVVNLQDWLREVFGDVVTFANETKCKASDFVEVTPQSLAISIEGNKLLSLYCCDVAVEYLNLLEDRLPDALKCFILIDGTEVVDPILLAQLTAKERYSRLYLAIKCTNFSEGEIAWESPALPAGMIGCHKIITKEVRPARIGICLPPITRRRPSEWRGFGKVFTSLTESQVPFRVISEVSLTTEWDCLDYLIISSQNLSVQGRRKLNGFCAAGGVVVTIGEPIGLAQEINFADFIPIF